MISYDFDTSHVNIRFPYLTLFLISVAHRCPNEQGFTILYTTPVLNLDSVTVRE